MGLFSAVVSPFFSKVFIAIDIDALTCTLKIVRIKNHRTIESITKEFRATESKLPMDAIKLIRKYKRAYPFTYVSAVIKALSQGVVLQKDSKNFVPGNIRLGECEIVSNSEIKAFAKRDAIKDFIAKRYARIDGIDFLFSPFLLINYNAQEMPTLGNNIYVLLQRSNIALMVVNKNRTTFGGFFIAEGEVPILDKEDARASVELKNFDDFSLDEDFDDFAKIELNPSLENLQTDMFIPNLDETKIIYDDMPKAKIISKIILDAIREYYQNPLYRGEFIDKVIFLDACKMSDHAFEFIAKEMMLETIKRDFNLPDMLIQFAQKELKGT